MSNDMKDNNYFVDAVEDVVADGVDDYRDEMLMDLHANRINRYNIEDFIRESCYESTRPRRSKIRRVVAEIRDDTFKKTLKVIVPVTLAAGILIGGIGTTLVGNGIDTIHDSQYYSEKTSEFRSDYIAPNTHRTQDNTGYWYDYQKISEGIKANDNQEEAIFICYLCLDTYQTGKVLHSMGMGTFTEYINKLGFKDAEEYEKYMFEKINLNNEINDKKDELQKMIDDHTYEYNVEDDKSNSLGGM